MQHPGQGLARRRYQRGQLIQKGSIWLGRWREDVVTASGAVKRVHKKQYLGTSEDFPTKRLAERELARRIEPINNLEYRPSRRVTFAVFADRWMKEVLVMQKRSSQCTARSHVRVHLLPAFGETMMTDIRMEAIQRFVTASGRSPKTTKNVVATLMSMWSTAQGWEYVHHNPFLRNASGRLLLRLPAACPSLTYSFTRQEAQAIIERANGRWKTFFRIMAHTGMRPGEVAGLRRDAIGDGALTITQSVWGQRIQTAKSRAGVRTIAISPELASELRDLVNATPDNEFGLIFVTDLFETKKGRRPRYAGGARPLSMDNFRSRMLEPILVELGIRAKLKQLGIKRCGNYAFRHMNATLMDTINTPMKTRQKRLGHAQIETTLKHYTHAVDADDRVAADQIGALLSPK